MMVWRRFWARQFDYFVSLPFLLFLLSLCIQLIFFLFRAEYKSINLQMALLFCSPFVWLLAESIFISRFQFTPGKYLLGLKIKSIDNKEILFNEALIRSCQVMLYSFIPIISIFLMLKACFDLQKEKTTIWDKNKFQVTLMTTSYLKVIIFIFLFFLVFTFRTLLILGQLKTLLNIS